VTAAVRRRLEEKAQSAKEEYGIMAKAFTKKQIRQAQETAEKYRGVVSELIEASRKEADRLDKEQGDKPDADGHIVIHMPHLDLAPGDKGFEETCLWVDAMFVSGRTFGEERLVDDEGGMSMHIQISGAIPEINAMFALAKTNSKYLWVRLA
jgi:hypothetical protein